MVSSTCCGIRTRVLPAPPVVVVIFDVVVVVVVVVWCLLLIVVVVVVVVIGCCCCCFCCCFCCCCCCPYIIQCAVTRQVPRIHTRGKKQYQRVHDACQPRWGAEYFYHSTFWPIIVFLTNESPRLNNYVPRSARNLFFDTSLFFWSQRGGRAY